jgi:hypothetical protein
VLTSSPHFLTRKRESSASCLTKHHLPRFPSDGSYLRPHHLRYRRRHPRLPRRGDPRDSFKQVRGRSPRLGRPGRPRPPAAHRSRTWAPAHQEQGRLHRPGAIQVAPAVTRSCQPRPPGSPSQILFTTSQACSGVGSGGSLRPNSSPRQGLVLPGVLNGLGVGHEAQHAVDVVPDRPVGARGDEVSGLGHCSHSAPSARQAEPGATIGP